MYDVTNPHRFTSWVSACQSHLYIHNTKLNPGDARLNMTQCALCLMYAITGSQCQRAEEEERPWAIDQCPGSRGEESVRLQYSPLRWPTHCPHHTIIITYWHQPAQGANNTHYIYYNIPTKHKRASFKASTTNNHMLSKCFIWTS